MTPNKQVSPVIRISRGERDASARATHLEAATRKFLVTTNERKYMSTKTNFKRVALVAVAALGLGVLSSVPSQAATTSIAIAATNGTATTTKADSTTAASFTVSASFLAVGDSLTVTLVNKSAPSTAGAYVSNIYLKDTSVASLRVDNAAQTDSAVANAIGISAAVQLSDSRTVGTADAFTIWSSANAFGTATFGLQIDSAVANPLPVAGTYTYQIVLEAYSGGTLNTIQPTPVDVSIVVATPTTASKVVTSNSTAVMGELAYTGGTTDSTVAASATASTTAAATIVVTLKNSSSLSVAQESITVSIDKGRIGLSGGTTGRSVTPVTAAGANTFQVFADGTSGVATIKISTPSYTFPNKTITFYGDATAIKAGAISSVVGNASTLGVWGTATDATSTDLGAGTDLYAYSSDTTVISNYGTACTWNSTSKYAECSLTGVKDGTASITLRDASTVAASTVASSAVSVRSAVNKVATTYKVTTSASSFAPGAPGVILVTVYDADGKVMPAGVYSNLFTTGGITATLPLGTSINGTIASSSVTTAANPVASATLPVVSLDPVMQYYYYMPVTGGTLGLVHKGGSSLPAAAQVTTTNTVTITDNAAAALAAVTALATTVASLKTLITTLTNLVLKIQKKVKA